MNGARAWLVFAVGAVVYAIAIVQRTSFGVASVEATERYGVAAAAVAVVPVVHVVVYALLQVPAGLLSDRFGPRRLVIIGAVLMAVGQLGLAFAPTLWVAIAVRVLCGAGDALTFVSIVRMIPTWFSGRIVPQLIQWIGMLGALGQVVSAVGFAALLARTGWTPAFSVLAGVSVLAAVLATGILRYRELPVHTGPIPTGSTFARLRHAAARPGTQLAFWAHLSSGHTNAMMSILWGYPFLRTGLDLDTGTAATIFSLIVLGNVLPAPFIGLLAAQFPMRRSTVVFAITAGIYLVWAVVLLWPATPPVWLVGVLFFAIGVGGPSSLIGLDLARTLSPRHAIGTVSGIVNSGGFVGAFVGMLGVGIVLDVVDQVRVASGAVPDLYALNSFRLAFIVPFLITAIGLTGVFVTRARVRRDLRERHGIVIAPLWVVTLRTWRAASASRVAARGKGRSRTVR